MGAFFPLYLKRSRDSLITNRIFTKFGGDDENEVINCFLTSEPMVESYDFFGIM